jgi:hypothetical protein
VLCQTPEEVCIILAFILISSVWRNEYAQAFVEQFLHGTLLHENVSPFFLPEAICTAFTPDAIFTFTCASHAMVWIILLLFVCQ